MLERSELFVKYGNRRLFIPFVLSFCILCSFFTKLNTRFITHKTSDALNKKKLICIVI